MKSKVFITKYALTDGIFEVEAEIEKAPSHCKKNLCAWCKLKPDEFMKMYIQPDFHYDLKSAIADAESRRENEIKNLKKEIEYLESLKFNITKTENIE
jgi:hypothetical protein